MRYEHGITVEWEHAGERFTSDNVWLCGVPHLDSSTLIAIRQVAVEQYRAMGYDVSFETVRIKATKFLRRRWLA
jgi:hypothetical protein